MLQKRPGLERSRAENHHHTQKPKKKKEETYFFSYIVELLTSTTSCLFRLRINVGQNDVRLNNITWPAAVEKQTSLR